MKKVLNAFVLAAATGICISPVWSQERPSSTQPAPTDRNPTQPGRDQNMPPAARENLGTPGLSKEDIRKVEQALQAKGHNPGQVDGVMDDNTRTAIRAFQKANNLSQTGTVDHDTAAKLGVSLSQQPGGKSGASGERSQSGSGSGSQVIPRDDQAQPRGGQPQQPNR